MNQHQLPFSHSPAFSFYLLPVMPNLFRHPSSLSNCQLPAADCRLADFFLKFSILFILLQSTIFNHQSFSQVPTGFVNQTISNTWTETEGFTWDANGQMYVWEKAGKVWIIDTNGVKLPQPLIDISEEVGNWRDHGLNGFCLDPDFLNNGYIYFDYTVDRHYLMFFGTGSYNSSTNDYYSATIERVTRYKADAASNFTTLVPGSRFILIGQDKKSGIPVLHESHSGACLAFGSDGTLLISTGDGASYNFADGGGGGTYWSQALTDTIIRPKENIGAFRSQMLDSYNGKLLRIDPLTGNGISSNPFYDASDPGSRKSKVWALGFRNPFRFTVRPNTGSTDPTAGDPGVIYLGDVQWDTWEELHVINGPAFNCGWPLYEGLTPNSSYQALTVYNQDAPNPLFGIGGCTQQYFTFKNLLRQATLDTTATFPNPCNLSQTIADSTPVFFHSRPWFDWNHSQVRSRTATWNGLLADDIDMNDALNIVPGPMFQGAASVGGAWYTGLKYPLQYQQQYYHGDYVAGWIKKFSFASDDTPDSVADFGANLGPVVYIAQNPKDSLLWFVSYPNEIHRIVYTAGVNNPPTAVATADTIYGVSPLTVNLDGSQSTDPENRPLTYSWDFGDGFNSNAISPVHVFTAPIGVPTTYTVVLTVTDDTLQSASDTLHIYINNTPPVVQIISFNDGDLFSMSHNTNLPLQANVTDAEHGPSELFYNWKVFLHHNQHEHPEAPDTNRITSTVISPVGCDGNIYYYRVELTVTDAGGLSTTVQASVYPACDPPVADFAPSDTSICAGGQITFNDLSSNLPDSVWWEFQGGNPAASTDPNPVITYSIAGTFDVQLVAQSVRGIDTLFLPGFITVNALPFVSLGLDTTLCGNSFTLDAGNPGSFYLWNTLATTQQIIVTSSGNYSVTVTTAPGCTGSDNITVTLFTPPVVTLTPFTDDSICIDAATVTLTGGLPAGGAYSGAGVSGGVFDPAIAGAGVHLITYQYTDLNGCSGSDAKSISVFDLPVVTFSPLPNDTVCIYNSPFTLTGGNPPGGNYSGTGVTANIFDPAAAGLGLHAVTYHYTDLSGCTDSASQNVFVDVCAGINSINATNQIIITPNPVHSDVTIHLSQSSSDNTIIKIFSTAGQLLQEEKIPPFTSDFSFTFTDSNGIYFLQLITDKHSVVKKIVKE